MFSVEVVMDVFWTEVEQTNNLEYAIRSARTAILDGCYGARVIERTEYVFQPEYTFQNVIFEIYSNPTITEKNKVNWCHEGF